MFTKLSKAMQIFVGAMFALVGGAFVFFGIMGIMHPVETAETEAVIREIHTDFSGDSITYMAEVTYVVDDTEYRGFVGCSSRDKEGDTIAVSYDVSNPENVGNANSGWVVYVLTGVGALAVIFGVVTIVKTFKKNPENDVQPHVTFSAPESAEPFDTSNATLYYFHWCGKLNQSYVLETPDREAVFRADCHKITLFRPYDYDFVDAKTGSATRHLVSHTVTSRYGTGSDNVTFSAVAKSSFKIDDVDVWELLHTAGYKVVPRVSSLRLNFDVFKGDKQVAFLESAGVNVAKGTSYKLGDKLPADGVYKVYVSGGDIEQIFTACFAVSRVEFF